MVVVIAPEKDIENEIALLNQLFKAGLKYYHLRKPNKTYQQYCEYINQIDKEYHNRIVVHFFHELVNTYELKGIHFQEQKRRDIINTIGSYLEKLNIKGKTISSSFHETLELENCEFSFDYHLLSPVFSSISKQGYEGKVFDVNHINKKVIGMGGVTPKNIEAFKKLGFKGVGVLGGVWHNENPVKALKKIKRKFNGEIINGIF